MDSLNESLHSIACAFTGTQSRAVMEAKLMETGQDGGCNESSIHESSILVILSGALDGENSAAFLASMKQLLDLAAGQGFGTLVLDLQGLSYASSAGMGILMSILTVAKMEGVQLILQNLSDKVLGVIRLLGFESFFTIR